MIFDAGPQSGGRRPAPGRLGLAQAFVNSHFDLGPGRTRGADRFASASGLADWLSERGLTDADGPRPREDERRRAVAVREGLRSVLAAHTGAASDPAALTTLSAVTQGLRSGVAISPDGSACATSASPDVDGALGLVLAVVAEAQAAGTWRRLKACPGEHCGWAFYDHSRNAGSTWCSMAVCGGREKARAYRRRSRA